MTHTSSSQGQAFAARRPVLGALRRLAFAAAAFGAALGQAFAEPALDKTEIRYQGWAGQVSFHELAEDLGYLAPLKLKYVGNTISGPQDIQSVATGDVDIGGAFYGAVIKLIAAKAPVKAVIGNYGSDDNTWQGFFVKDDSPIRGPRDLIGKKVAVNTLGAHLEFVLREYLTRGGLTAEEIRQVTLVVVPPVTGEQALRQGQVEVTTLAGVLRDKALERGGIRKLFSDIELFGHFTGGPYVLHTKFIRDNPAAARKLVEGIARAIEWERTTPPSEVRARFEKIIAARKRNEDASAIKYWNSTGIADPGGVITDQQLQVWIDWLVKDGTLKAGQLKAADLYTNEFNPYAAETSAKTTGAAK
ncbi:ABC transporter substrate-binding protein [Bradyrhizobium sp. 2TAF24]|uniref:ABC transporter substrate-binding protein n=1 Tax=Bradyrhizobium sp. 2TAF24 TaxID=3233011 RepID=UPI003F8FCC9F